MELVPAQEGSAGMQSPLSHTGSLRQGVMAPERCVLFASECLSDARCPHPECGSQQADPETQDALLIT